VGEHLKDGFVLSLSPLGGRTRPGMAPLLLPVQEEGARVKEVEANETDSHWTPWTGEGGREGGERGSGRERGGGVKGRGIVLLDQCIASPTLVTQHG